MENESERSGHTYPDLQFPEASNPHLGDSYTSSRNQISMINWTFKSSTPSVLDDLNSPLCANPLLTHLDFIVPNSRSLIHHYEDLWDQSVIVQLLQRAATWDDLWNVAAPILDEKSHPAHPKTQPMSKGNRREWNSGTNPGRTGGTHPVAVGDSAKRIAYEKAKKYWIEQRNWNDKYDEPYHQFVYQQIPKERIRIEGDAGVATADINTRAYRNVLRTWVDRCVWNNEWGLLPGMKWMHEEVRYENITHNPVQVNLSGNGSPEAGDAPTQPVLEPVQSNHHRESGESGVNETPQSDLGGLVNSQVERSSPLWSSSAARNGKQAPRPSTRQPSLQTRRKRSHREDSKLTPLTSIAQRLVCLTMPKDVTRKQRRGLQRQSDSSEKRVSSYRLPLSPSVDNVDELSLP